MLDCPECWIFARLLLDKVLRPERNAPSSICQKILSFSFGFNCLSIVKPSGPRRSLGPVAAMVLIFHRSLSEFDCSKNFYYMVIDGLCDIN